MIFYCHEEDLGGKNILKLMLPDFCFSVGYGKMKVGEHCFSKETFVFICFLSSFINLKNKIIILKRNTLSNIIPKCKTSCVFYLLSFVLRLA